jgi:hypothetical protein
MENAIETSLVEGDLNVSDLPCISYVARHWSYIFHIQR